MNSFKSLYKNRYVLQELVRKSVKTQYRNSFLGMVWTVLNPLLNMLVMWVIFKNLFGRDEMYPLYLLSGNILFACLRSATDGALGSIVHNRGLLTRIKIDSYLFPLSSIFSSIVSFLFSIIALLMIMLIFEFSGIAVFSFKLFAIILMIPAFMLFEYGIGLFLSAIYVFARDIKYLYSVFLTLWTYITPIFYYADTLKSSFATTVIHLNPMYYFVTFFRGAIYNGWTNGLWSELGLLYLFGVVSVIIGYLIFRPLNKKFVTNI